MRVLISGYYGCGNLGDEALLAGLIAGLRRHEYELTVLSGNPVATTRLHQVAAVHRYKGLVPALFRADALISGGGGLLQDKTSARSLRYYLGVIRLAKLSGKKVVVYGQSMGPLSETGKRRVAEVLRNTPTAVRDQSSLELLHALGMDAFLTADAALTLPPPQPLKEAIERPVLLIPRGGYPEITRSLAALAAELVRRGRRVGTMGFQTDEDTPEISALQSSVPGLEPWHADTPQAALERIGGSSYVVSARLHGLILAAVAGRGFSGIVYDPKVAAFLDEAGAPGHDAPPDITALIEDVQTQRGSDPRRLKKLIMRAESGLDWLHQALQS